MPLWIAFAALGFSIAYLFGVFTWFDYVICDNDGLCKTQGKRLPQQPAWDFSLQLVNQITFSGVLPLLSVCSGLLDVNSCV